MVFQQKSRYQQGWFLYTVGFPIFISGVDHIIIWDVQSQSVALHNYEFHVEVTLLRDDRYTFKQFLACLARDCHMMCDMFLLEFYAKLVLNLRRILFRIT